MKFEFTHQVRRSGGRRSEAATFVVDKLWAMGGGLRRDVSHLIDRSYGYHSARELRWHLADRFGLDVSDVGVSAA